MFEIGHNSNPSGVARDQLRSIVSRIEKLEADKAEITADIRDVYAEAKGNGFDVKALRAIIRLRKQNADERAEHQAHVEIYMDALGPLADTPLGQAAVKRAAGLDEYINRVADGAHG